MLKILDAKKDNAVNVGVKTTVVAVISICGKFRLLLILIEGIVMSILKNQFTMKIEPVTCI